VTSRRKAFRDMAPILCLSVRTNTQKTPKDATTGDQKTLKRHQKTIKEAKRPQK